MASANATSVRQRFKPPLSSSSTSTNRTAISPSSNKKTLHPPPSRPFELPPIAAFYILLAAHTLSALYHPINDCDEVFNYWEPVHYLTHGLGFQTWECAPMFAIRSWAYAGIHAIIILTGKVVGVVTGLAGGQGGRKVVEFYTLRIFLGLFCALCETRLFSKVSALIHPRVALIFLAVLATSPGIAHASISFLPSSFSMYTTTLGLAAFMDWRGGLRTAQGIFCFGAGAVVGWPFAAAMAAPFLAEEVLLAALSDVEGRVDFLRRVLDGTVRTLLVLAALVAVDVFFYKKVVVVPWNIVYYNVFAGSSGGPDLYGTEPWHFYLRNLALNFHFFLPLALVAMPLLLIQHFGRFRGATRSYYLRGIVFLSPFYLWLAIFSLQKHKEERFMYPLYPCLALNAAWSAHILLANILSTDSRDFIGRVPLRLRYLVVAAFTFLALALSVFRTVGTITAFSAPLSIYEPLHGLGLTSETTLCLGKEWYRFPSHFLLPENVKAKFIKSEFDGLLPGEFHEGGANQGFGFFPGTWLEPTGMNDQNKEDVGKYVDVRRCDFLVDSKLESMPATKLEPDFISDTESWERVKCLPFLDAGATGLVGRLGWIPDLPFVPQRMKRVWGEYCLLKRRKKLLSGRGEERVDTVPRVETLG